MVSVGRIESHKDYLVLTCRMEESMPMMEVQTQARELLWQTRCEAMPVPEGRDRDTFGRYPEGRFVTTMRWTGYRFGERKE